LKVAELEGYLAKEIGKEVNNANNRELLSYSKSLGVCLLKYNKYTDNELRINKFDTHDFVYYYDVKAGTYECESYSLAYGLHNIGLNVKIRKLCF